MKLKRKKRSAPDEVVLMPVSPQRRKRKYVYSGLLVIFLILAAYIGGEVRGRQGELAMQQERYELTQQVKKLEQQLAQARQQAAIHKTGTEVTREAEEKVRQQLKTLTGQVAELEEAVAFYKNVMSPGSTEKGVHIESFELMPASEPSHYQYKLVLTQRGDNRYHVRGSVELVLQGHNDVEPVTLSRDLLVSGSDTSFRFRYFQELTGTIQLPEGFQPEQVRLKASARGNRPSTAERSFVWQIQESSNNVWAG